MSEQDRGAAGVHQGQLLQRLRFERSLSSFDLATRAGLDHQRVVRLEREAQSLLPIETREGILAALDASTRVGDADRAAFLKPAIVVHAPAPGVGNNDTWTGPAAPGRDAECSGPGRCAPDKLPTSYTSFGLLLRGLRLERRIPVADLAALTCMPDECIEAAEVAGPIAPHLTERLLKALDDHAPLSAEQVELYRDLGGIGELPLKLTAPRRKNDRAAGVGARQESNGDRQHPGNAVATQAGTLDKVA